MIQNQINIIGPVNKDIDPRSMPPNMLSDANDAEFLSATAGQDESASALPSSLKVYDIPQIETQYQIVRLRYNPVISVTGYTFEITDSTGVILVSVLVPVGASLAADIATLNTYLTGYTLVVDGAMSGVYYKAYLRQGAGTPVGYTIKLWEETASTSTEIPVFTLQDYYNPISALDQQFQQLQSFELNNISFVYSRTYDGVMHQLGYATENQSGTWTYVTLMVTRNLAFPSLKVIEVQGETINSGSYALYWIDDTNKPKVAYIPTTLGAYSMLKYNTTSYNAGTTGVQTLESIDKQTDLQIQNPARAAYSDQLESGGGLQAGTWWYFVAVGMNNNYSEYSYASQPFAVFSASTTAPSAGAYIGGDKTPTLTSKINVIQVYGADAKVYNTLRLAAVLCQGGAYSATIVGEYAITTTDFVLQHTGLESGTEIIDVASLPPVQEVITSAKNLQLKKNRLNLANVGVANDANLESIFQDVTLGQTTSELDHSGYINFSGSAQFRAQITEAYSDTTTGSQRIKLYNDSTAPNFDTTGVFDPAINVWAFTVPATGNYTLSVYLKARFGETAGGAELFGPVKSYVLNTSTTPFTQYCVSDPPTPFPFIAGVYVTQVVNLTAGDVLCFSADFVNQRPGAITSYSVVDAYFTATKVISNYPLKSLAVGEYQVPENIATKPGYMVNETYPFYGRAHYTNGYVSSWYYIGNYRFDGGGTYATLANGSITTSAAIASMKVLSHGLTINGLDISTIKSSISKIEIGRGICNPTILGTGVFIPAHGTIGGTDGGKFKTGYYAGDIDGTSASYGSVVAAASALRYHGFMICPDWMTGEKPTFQSGDYLIVYGVGRYLSNSSLIVGADAKYGAYREFTGAFLPLQTGSPGVYAATILDAEYTEFNTNSGILKNATAGEYMAASVDNTGTIDTLATEGMAMTLSSKIVCCGAGTLALGDDMGVYYVQYVRANANQYDSKNTIVVSTNTFVDINLSTADVLPQINVYGGDTYTQKTYAKILYNAKNTNAAQGGTLTSFIGFYSQNKINQQMRFVDKSFTNLPFPFGTDLDRYLFGKYEAQEQFQIDKGYTWELPIGKSRSYDSNIPKPTSFPARIYYSQQKPAGSLQDWYRTLLPIAPRIALPVPLESSAVNAAMNCGIV